jgi:hypothetical protein
MGVQHFTSIFKEPKSSNINEIVKVASYFPRLISDEDNQTLFKEVSKDKFLIVLSSFQKDKSPSLDGWTIELYLFFFTY